VLDAQKILAYIPSKTIFVIFFVEISIFSGLILGSPVFCEYRFFRTNNSWISGVKFCVILGQPNYLAKHAMRVSSKCVRNWT
jgi:hypothetical protein